MIRSLGQKVGYTLRAAGVKLARLRERARARREPQIGWWSDTMDRWAAEEHYAGRRWN